MQNLELQLLILFLGAIIWTVVLILVVSPDKTIDKVREELEAHERNQDDKL